MELKASGIVMLALLAAGSSLATQPLWAKASEEQQHNIFKKEFRTDIRGQPSTITVTIAIHPNETKGNITGSGNATVVPTPPGNVTAPSPTPSGNATAPPATSNQTAPPSGNQTAPPVAANATSNQTGSNQTAGGGGMVGPPHTHLAPGGPPIPLQH